MAEQAKTESEPEATGSTPVAALKGFDADLKCKGLQFEVGKTYLHEGEIAICESGFHAIEGHPFEIWEYYPPACNDGRLARYGAVTTRGKIARDKGDSKICAASITIDLELFLPEFIKRGVDYILSHVDFDNAEESLSGDRSAATNTGDRSAATNTGYHSAATNTGDQSAATNTGDQSAATNTGDRSAATNTGDRSAATNTGDRSAATNTGYQSAATNTGDQSAATNTGDHSAATNTGYQSAASVEGKYSVAVASGYMGRAKASAGSAIFLVERNLRGEILSVFAGIAGRNGIEADTWYTLKDGALIAAGKEEAA